MQAVTLDFGESPCVDLAIWALDSERFSPIHLRQAGARANVLAKYVEVDFAENTTKKAMAIRKSKELGVLLGNQDDVSLSNGGTTIHSPVYHLLPADLRRNPSESLAPLLASSSSDGSPMLSNALPTLLLFECVLAYMHPEDSDALIAWFVEYFSTEQSGVLGGLVYEMFGLQDAFGKVMHTNLKARNVSLPGVEPYASVASLPTRFTRHGFTTSHAITLRDIRRSCVNQSELERISHLELLDEVEELDLVLEHYAVTWGVKVNCVDAQALWREWGFKPGRN